MEAASFSISTLLTDCGTVITTVCTTVAENPVLAVFLGLGLLTTGAVAFRKLRKTSKG